MSDRTLRIALIISVVVNIFVIGGVAGAAWMWRRAVAERPLAGFGRPARLRQAAEALSPDDRVTMRQAVRATVLSLRPEIRKARDARRDAGNILIQPAFDPAAMNAALARARASDFTVRTKLEQSVVDVAAKLPQPERQALAAGLMRSAARPPRQPADQPGK